MERFLSRLHGLRVYRDEEDRVLWIKTKNDKFIVKKNDKFIVKLLYTSL